jgi:hypothetical protein
MFDEIMEFLGSRVGGYGVFEDFRQTCIAVADTETA